MVSSIRRKNERKRMDRDNNHLSLYMLHLLKNENVPANNKVDLNKIPDWIDMELYRLGHQFYQRNLIAITICDLIGLCLSYSKPNVIDALIYTGKSVNMVKGFRRYISTGLHINNFFNGDIWENDTKAHRSIKYVRDSHERVRQKIKNETKEELAKRKTLAGQGVTNLNTYLYKELVADIQSACPMKLNQLRDKGNDIDNEVEYFNQINMILVVVGMMLFPVLFPKKIGIYHESKKDIEGFIHLWRVIGYYLGIEDEFNLCNGNYEEVFQRGHELIDYSIKPWLYEIDLKWIHMTHILVDSSSITGLSIPYSTILLIAFECIDIPSKNIWKFISFKEKCIYYFVQFILKWVFWIKPISNYLSHLMLKHIQRHFDLIRSPENLKKFTELARKYDETVQ